MKARRGVSILLALCLLLSTTALAAETEITADKNEGFVDAVILTENSAGEGVSEPDDALEFDVIEDTIEIDWPDNDELFAAYVDQVLYEGTPLEAEHETQSLPVYYASDYVSKNLYGAARDIYNTAKSVAISIADGSRTSTVFSVETTLVGSVSDRNDLLKKVAKQAIHAVMADCPFEMYWFGKSYTIGGSILDVTYNQNGTASMHSILNFTLEVAKEYQRNGIVSEVRKDIAAVGIAKKNAADIVAKHSGKDDLNKLWAYANEICALTDYNTSAAKNPDTPYGNPWQLIWIFDKDPSTKVVCEGYAKGFQYLCDLSSFTGKVSCRSVTGYMDGGPHMWNVVTYDGSNYMVDVTNIDEGNYASPGLFMTFPLDGTYRTGYTYYDVVYNMLIRYVYDEDTLSLYKGNQIAVFGDYGDLTADWYRKDIRTATFLDLMNGTDVGLFNPSGATTRGMLVTILYRLEGEPEVSGKSKFSDVPSGKYYSKAVAWAAANGIVTGYDGNVFKPNNPVTREQVAAILYRYIDGYKKLDVSKTASLSKYKDANQISSFAKTAMPWANAEGLINGIDSKTLNPKGNATRAQIATILVRLCDRYKLKQ